MAQTAASKVLQIPELFEQILRELPQRDILLNVQRTCRAWKAVVDTSPPIQRRLFFAPARAGDDIEWEQRSLDIYTVEGMNPMCEVFDWTPVWESWSILRNDGTVWVGFLKQDPTKMVQLTGSWQRMFLRQPPMRNVTLFITLGGLLKAVFKVEREGGLRFEDVLEEGAKMLARKDLVEGKLVFTVED